MAKNKKDKECDISCVISDAKNGIDYTRSAFLGKGAFGKCFELIDSNTGKSYAGKIVSKDILRKADMKEKIVQEICIHKKLNHMHIVGFHGFFEDERFVYIVLELCRRKSMAELHKRRTVLTEPEVRYYMKQIMSGVKYLHEKNIIHRDLKLGNLFINENMLVKIGDFGLSTEIENDERKKTMCGTPNYIAPEILEKKGHGFEVDIWSLGCILFTLLVGKPPFETSTIKETYSRIRRCEYKIPCAVNKFAGEIFRCIFVKDPNKRPKINELIQDQFFKEGYTPPSLPVSCLVIAPKFGLEDQFNLKKRKPLSEINISKIPTTQKIPETMLSEKFSLKLAAEEFPLCTGYNYLRTLRRQLIDVLKSKPAERENIKLEEAEDPVAHPIVWISSWVDYSEKYGFAYKLNDNSIGVVFIDNTKLVLLSNGIDIQFTNKDGSEMYFKINDFDPKLKKKMRLLELFQQYMGHLVKAGACIPIKESDSFMRVPVLCDWARYDRSVVMLLSNGTLQLNFFPDHSKIILCPLMGAVTCIDRNEVFHTYRLKLIKQYGCSKALDWKLQYVVRKINEMIEDGPKVTN